MPARGPALRVTGRLQQTAIRARHTGANSNPRTSTEEAFLTLLTNSVLQESVSLVKRDLETTTVLANRFAVPHMAALACPPPHLRVEQVHAPGPRRCEPPQHLAAPAAPQPGRLVLEQLGRLPHTASAQQMGSSRLKTRRLPVQNHATTFMGGGAARSQSRGSGSRACCALTLEAGRETSPQTRAATPRGPCAMDVIPRLSAPDLSSGSCVHSTAVPVALAKNSWHAS